MKIKAAVLNQMGAEPPYDKSKPLSIEEFELDDPGHGEVMVKIGAAGLCHSDLSVIDGNRPRPTPMVLGHEAAGIVEKLGTRRRRPKGRRSRGDGVRPELRALLAMCGGPSRAVRARCRLQRRGHAALWRAPTASQWRRGPPSSRRARLSRNTRQSRAGRW